MIRSQVQFPDTFKKISTDRLLEIYERGPERLTWVLQGLTRTDLLSKPRPDKWSILEIVMHLVDSEIASAFKIRQVYTQTSRELPWFGQDIWACTLEYQNVPLDIFNLQLRQFELLRKTTRLIFDKACEDDWYKTGIHPVWGEVTLRNLLELDADHSERHIQQILEIRSRLDREIQFLSLLPEKLY